MVSIALCCQFWWRGVAHNIAECIIQQRKTRLALHVPSSHELESVIIIISIIIIIIIIIIIQPLLDTLTGFRMSCKLLLQQ